LKQSADRAVDGKVPRGAKLSRPAAAGLFDDTVADNPGEGRVCCTPGGILVTHDAVDHVGDFPGESVRSKTVSAVNAKAVDLGCAVHRLGVLAHEREEQSLAMGH
jgi:hypothetical protein